MSAPIGAGRDLAIQRAREALAVLLNATTPWQWEAPAPERVAARARARS